MKRNRDYISLTISLIGRQEVNDYCLKLLTDLGYMDKMHPLSVFEKWLNQFPNKIYKFKSSKKVLDRIDGNLSVKHIFYDADTGVKVTNRSSVLYRYALILWYLDRYLKPFKNSYTISEINAQFTNSPSISTVRKTLEDRWMFEDLKEFREIQESLFQYVIDEGL